MRETLVTRLQAGETVQFRPHGNSMTPRIRSGQRVTVAPVELDAINVGDIVLARVRGVLRLHKISAIDSTRRRVQISNNHGYVNGWTGYDRVYGVCVKVE
jgi:Peptidase S24-like